jgi:hypothetical protein
MFFLARVVLRVLHSILIVTNLLLSPSKSITRIEVKIQTVYIYGLAFKMDENEGKMKEIDVVAQNPSGYNTG